MELGFHQKVGSEPLQIGYLNLYSLHSIEALVFKISVLLRYFFSSFVFRRLWKLIECQSMGFLLI